MMTRLTSQGNTQITLLMTDKVFGGTIVGISMVVSTDCLCFSKTYSSLHSKNHHESSKVFVTISADEPQQII
ncbi:hypothetical protein M0813_22779 [Anaeramoeba flamelloides]|uniref:Uncharacterized protein n=1 Tax=Anaeramoeba flamelloides TaxID=1746091 RepID=A0ABQ8YCI7_9EUKA|nr:hypothetical protein M0813_22779 [Anaeramoeba flamelloides]